MLEDLDIAQHALAEFMSGLSEKAFYAAWMNGLEYALWEVVLGEREVYGHWTVSRIEVDALRELSNACDGWIVFDDDAEETWIGRDEWAVRFGIWRAAQSKGLDR